MNQISNEIHFDFLSFMRFLFLSISLHINKEKRKPTDPIIIHQQVEDFHLLFSYLLFLMFFRLKKKTATNSQEC